MEVGSVETSFEHRLFAGKKFFYVKDIIKKWVLFQ